MAQAGVALSLAEQGLQHIDSSVVNAMMTELADGDAFGAVHVLTAAVGVPSWGVDALVALMQDDVAAARVHVESGIGGSSAALIGRLLEHQLNVSGIPVDILEAAGPEVALAVVTGNVSRAVHALAAAYDLPSWSADALVGLTSSSQPGSSSSGGLASLLSIDTSSTRLTELVSTFNVSAQMEALGLGTEYSDALQSGSAALVTLLASSTSLTARRRASESEAGATTSALGSALNKFTTIASTVSELQRALETGDVGLAVRSVVAAVGEEDSAIGQSLVVIATAASVPQRAATASTLTDVTSLISSALVVLPVDPRTSGLLGDLVAVGGLASELLRAASPKPQNPKSVIIIDDFILR